MERVKKNIHSLCPECLEVVDANIYTEDGAVMMEKECPRHGKFKAVAERDDFVYRNLCHIGPSNGKWPENEKRLIIPIEYRCNLNCIFCYLPHREKGNITFKQLKDIVSNYRGRYIELSGGEPTLREDIFEIIKMVKAAGKSCALVTNGIRLRDKNFVRNLKTTGIDNIFLSLYSNDVQIEADICGKLGVLEEKIAALKNIKALGIPLCLSMTVVPGENEGAIRNFISLAMQEDVKFVALRAVARVGKHPTEEKYFLSDFLKIIGHDIGLNYRDFLNNKCKHFTPYFIYIHLFSSECDPRIKLMKFPLLKAHNCNNKLLKRFWLLQNVLRDVGMVRLLSLLFKMIFCKRRTIKHVHMRIASWPDRFDVDLDETAFGQFEHLYRGSEKINFLEAMIFNEGL